MWSDILWFGIAFPCKWCWASFHVYVCHLYVFFRKMSVKIFCPFLNWIGYFFHIVVYEVKWKLLSRVRLFTTPWTIQSVEFFRPEYWSGILLQGIFPSQGSNPGLPHCRQILYQLSHKGRPRILDCVAFPFLRGSSQLRNRTRVSCIAGGFFTNWVWGKHFGRVP